MLDPDAAHRSNVIQFVRRPSAAAKTYQSDTPTSGAMIVAEACRRMLGTTDLEDFAVQSALDGVLRELKRLWFAEAELRTRAEIAGQDAAELAEKARDEPAGL